MSDPAVPVSTHAPDVKRLSPVSIQCKVYFAGSMYPGTIKELRGNTATIDFEPFESSDEIDDDITGEVISAINAHGAASVLAQIANLFEQEAGDEPRAERRQTSEYIARRLRRLCPDAQLIPSDYYRPAGAPTQGT
ncbi:MAG: hypothetical protein ACF8LL_10830 [Phycisphaerales bacterium]